jgi:cell wall-associated NlpC family hydrolase
MPAPNPPPVPPAAAPAATRRPVRLRWQAALRVLLLGALAGTMVGTIAGSIAGASPPVLAAGSDGTAAPASAVPGLAQRHLDPGFWIARHPDPHALRWTADRVAAHNARLLALDPSMHDLARLPAALPGAEVARRIRALSRRPAAPRFDGDGAQIDAAALDALAQALALDAIADSVPLRWALVVERAPLRTFPTRLRAHSAPGDADIDRFQESAEFPGTPLAVLHDSADGAWSFVLSPRYGAWVERRFLAEGPRATVLGYAAREPFRVVAGAKPRTVFNPDEPRVSELQLDMGVRLPVAAPGADGRIHGQHAHAAWPVELPVREADGSLAFAPALLPRHAGVSDGHLPHTAGNVIAQAFAFLGERYGWGHDYNGRDCSGFVSEVYASMGVALPRNTSDQSRSPALDHDAFDASTTPADREAALARLQVGDLVFVPGHVMLVIGQLDGAPWVIHDIHGGGVLEADGSVRRLGLNAVSVTPLLPLAFDDGTRYTERMTAIVRLR